MESLYIMSEHVLKDSLLHFSSYMVAKKAESISAETSRIRSLAKLKVFAKQPFEQSYFASSRASLFLNKENI